MSSPDEENNVSPLEISSFHTKRVTQLEKDIFGDSDDEESDLSDIDDRLIAETKPKTKRRASTATPRRRRTATNEGEGEKRKKKRTKPATEEGEYKEEPVNDKIEEARRDFEAALEAIKPRRRKANEQDTIQLDEIMRHFRDKMKAVAMQDIEFNERQLPALEKLKMLPLVVEQLEKKDLHEQFLDNGILDAIRMWLEPLKDGTLPNAKIRKTLLSLLRSMPIERDHLEESRIGRVIMFIYKCSRETQENRKLAATLINNWSRPILGNNASYRQLEDVESARQIALATSAPAEMPPTSTNSRRAAIPYATPHDFVLRPESRAKPNYIGTNRDKAPESLKHIQNNLVKLRAGSKKGSSSSFNL